MTITLTSTAFAHGQPIPKRYTGEGEDVSPPLAWEGIPNATRELALICDDPDAPTPEPWVHWVLYKIPTDISRLPEGLPREETLERLAGARQGYNSWSSGQAIGYRGPMPPPKHGRHRYHFRLYALDSALNLPAGADEKQLLKEMQGHILAQGELIGT